MSVKVLINPGQSVRDNGVSKGEGFNEIISIEDAKLWHKEGILKILPGQGIAGSSSKADIEFALNPITDEVDVKALSIQFAKMQKRIDELEAENAKLKAGGPDDEEDEESDDEGESDEVDEGELTGRTPEEQAKIDARVAKAMATRAANAALKAGGK